MGEEEGLGVVFVQRKCLGVSGQVYVSEAFESLYWEKKEQEQEQEQNFGAK